MENETPKANFSATWLRPLQRLVSPISQRWRIFDARYHRAINIFILLAILAFFGLAISLLKGYVQFI